MRRATWAAAVVFVAEMFLAGLGSTHRTQAQNAKTKDLEEESRKQAALERKERYTKWMRTFAEETVIYLAGEANETEHAATLVPTPVFRYSDEERFIPDATLWVWTRDARPVAFQKVEGNDHGGGKQWTICFASLSEGLIRVRWPHGRPYAAQTPGVTFNPIPGAEPPAANARSRILQIKAIKERFAGRLGVDANGKNGAETRTIAKPIFEYADPDSKLPLGAIFGMSATGTNPDLLLLIEARRDEDGKWRWEYAHARMTSASLIVRLDDADVWSEAAVPVSNAVFENWTFYFLPRGFK